RLPVAARAALHDCLLEVRHPRLAGALIRQARQRGVEAEQPRAEMLAGWGALEDQRARGEAVGFAAAVVVLVQARGGAGNLAVEKGFELASQGVKTGGRPEAVEVVGRMMLHGFSGLAGRASRAASAAPR